MKVECQKCGMGYTLDETLVATSGTSVRCSKCGDVFRVFPNSGITDAGDEWTVNLVNGETVGFKRMGMLQQWISKDKLSRDDMISRNGSVPKRIGDIPEMVSFFPSSPSETPVSSGFPKKEAAKDNATVSGVGATGNVDTLPPPPMEQGRPTQPKMMDSSAPVAQTVLAKTPLVKKSVPVTIQPGPPEPDNATKPTAPMKPVPESLSVAFDKTIAPSASSQMGMARTEPAMAPAPEPSREQAGQLSDDVDPMEAHEPDFSQIPASQEKENWGDGGEIPVESPAWAERNGKLGHYDDDIDLPPRIRKTGRWIVLTIVVVVIAVAAYFVKFQRARLGNIFDRMLSSSVDDRYNKFFDHGMESFLLDSDTNYRQADREFQKVLALEENHAPTLTALAQMYAVWAQYARDTKLDAQTDIGGAAESQSDKRELERLTREFEEKLSEAARWAQQSIDSDKDSPSANLAMADVKRLQGDLGQARLYLEKARSDQGKYETEYVSILIDQDLGKPTLELENRVDALLREESLIRAMYRKARFAASRGETAKAKATLGKLFELNSDHLRGRDLAARLDDKKTVALTIAASVGQEATAADAGVKEEAELPTFAATAEIPEAVETEEPAAAPVSNPTSGAPAFGSGGSVDALIIQASKLQEKGRSAEAVKLFEKALERSPSNVEALSGIAYCYLDKGNSGKAVASFRRALGVNASFGPALIGLAGTFKSLGQKEQALKYYKKYLDVKPNGGQSGLAKRNIAQLEEAVGVQTAAQEGASGTGGSSPASEGTGTGTPSSEEGSVQITPPSDGAEDKPEAETPLPTTETLPTTENPAGVPTAPAAPSNPTPPNEE